MKEQKGRRIALFLAVVVGAAALTGCNHQTQESSSDGTTQEPSSVIGTPAKGELREELKNYLVINGDSLLNEANVQWQNIDQTSADKNTEMTVKQVIYDQYIAHFLVEIPVPKEVKDQFDMTFQTLAVKENDSSEKGNTIEYDLSPAYSDQTDDSIWRAILSVRSSESMGNGSFVIDVENLGLGQSNQKLPDESGEPFDIKVEGHWSVTVTLGNAAPAIRLQPQKEATLRGCKVTVENIELSPLSLRVDMKGDLLASPQPDTGNSGVFDDIYLEMKDGSKSKSTGQGSSFSTEDKAVVFQYFKTMRDPGQVKAIHVGDAVFEI